MANFGLKPLRRCRFRGYFSFDLSDLAGVTNANRDKVRWITILDTHGTYGIAAFACSLETSLIALHR
jgi:hypothetical protein